MSDVARVDIPISDDHAKLLAMLAEEFGVSPSEMARQILEEETERLMAVVAQARLVVEDWP